MLRTRTILALAFVAAALPVPLATAEDAEPPKPPATATTAPAAPTTTGASAAPQHVEGETEESEHLPPSAATKEKPVARPPVVTKDAMVRVTGGRFTMGSSDKSAPANERPARVVIVPPFWLDKTEVSVGMYRACVDRGACPKPTRSSTLCTYDMGEPMLPVSCVPWAAAQTFCISAGKRLPREVEWEFAARGSSGGRGGGGGCGGGVTLASDKSQKSCGGKRPAKVGSHPGGASPFGVLDMSGNVEEWVADWYGEAVSDLSPRAGASHVLRGGGWLSSPAASRTTSRNWGSVRESGPNVGFRCARDD